MADTQAYYCRNLLSPRETKIFQRVCWNGAHILLYNFTLFTDFLIAPRFLGHFNNFKIIWKHLGKPLLGDKVKYIKSVQNLTYHLSDKTVVDCQFCEDDLDGSFEDVLAPFILMSSHATWVWVPLWSNVVCPVPIMGGPMTFTEENLKYPTSSNSSVNRGHPGFLALCEIYLKLLPHMQ